MIKRQIRMTLKNALVDFDLDQVRKKAIYAIRSKKLSGVHVLEEDLWKKLPGEKYVEIELYNYAENTIKDGREIDVDDDKDWDEEHPVFDAGIGIDKRQNKKQYYLWVEFDTEICPEKYLEKINTLIGTSSKYSHQIDYEFSQMFIITWLYISKFGLLSDDKIEFSLENKKETLTGFICEVLEKLYPSYLSYNARSKNKKYFLI